MVSTSFLQCVVVTPEKAVLDAKADFVAVPMYDGELGILPGRAPLIGRLGYGELRTRSGNNTNTYFIDGGFVEIRDNIVTVLTQHAEPQTGLDVEKASQELEAALQPGKSADEQQEQQNKQARARVKLRMAKKK